MNFAKFRLERVFIVFTNTEKRMLEKQKNILQFKLLEPRRTIINSRKREKNKQKHIESMVTSIFDLSNSFDGWGHKITVAVEHNESRLKVLSYQNDELLKQAGMLRKKMLCYKQVLKCDVMMISGRLRMRWIFLGDADSQLFMHVGIWHELTSTFFSLLEDRLIGTLIRSADFSGTID
ncbi:hypothetical protein HPP92_026525 [Vanilla planifolia]|uniref:Uncharacterized protein n=1 Tax=Vanilla planifolia TaxID=51239 RepID=A0A835U7X9_VANPL|nr:hypothetical protein HPP92_026525 [Vanilla planifolia]